VTWRDNNIDLLVVVVDVVRQLNKLVGSSGAHDEAQRRLVDERLPPRIVARNAQAAPIVTRQNCIAELFGQLEQRQQLLDVEEAAIRQQLMIAGRKALGHFDATNAERPDVLSICVKQLFSVFFQYKSFSLCVCIFI
jgi:hypothetical protein